MDLFKQVLIPLFKKADVDVMVSETDPLPVGDAELAAAMAAMLLVLSNLFTELQGKLEPGQPVDVGDYTPQGALEIADSAEREYTPGAFGGLATVVGDTVVYSAPAGKAFRIRSSYAVPVLRGTEDAPVITIKILNPDNSVFATPFVWAAGSKRKLITGPVGGKLVINLDIAARVPYSFDIQEFTP